MTLIAATTTPFPPQPTPPDPGQEPGVPSEPSPPQPEPDETPFTEPKHYPIHPDIPLQPIHENDPARCRAVGRFETLER